MSYVTHPFTLMTMINLMVACMIYLIIDYADLYGQVSLLKRFMFMLLVVIALSFSSFGIAVGWLTGVF